MSGHSKSKAFRPRILKSVEDLAQAERGDIWTAMPGVIESFDKDKQTATVKVQYKPRHKGKPVDMPDLLEVPVVFPRGGGGALTWPIKKGDGVQLQFQSRSMDKWYEEGKAVEAPGARMHDLSDAVAVPGLVASTKKLENFNNTNVELRSDNGSFKLEFNPESGKYKIKGADGEELFKIMHDLLEIMEAGTTTVTYGSSAGIHPFTHQPNYGALKARLDKIRLD